MKKEYINIEIEYVSLPEEDVLTVSIVEDEMTAGGALRGDYVWFEDIFI